MKQRPRWPPRCRARDRRPARPLIGLRLGTNQVERTRYIRVATEAYAAEPALIEAASLDLQAIIRRDPAIKGYLPPLLNFKGYIALQAWRVTNWLWRRERVDLARMIPSVSAPQRAVAETEGRVPQPEDDLALLRRGDALEGLAHFASASPIAAMLPRIH